MNKKDKIIAQALQKSFTPNPIKNRELCRRIENNLPPRSNTKLYLLITTGCAIIITALLILVQWINIAAIYDKLQNIITSPVTDKNETIIYTVGIITVGYIIVWQIFSFVDDYNSIKNDDILRQTLGVKE